MSLEEANLSLGNPLKAGGDGGKAPRTKHPIRRLGLAFHEGFCFVRSAVSEVLSLAARKRPGEKLNFELLRNETTLGRNYIKAMPRFCVGAGLLDSRNELT